MNDAFRATPGVPDVLVWRPGPELRVEIRAEESPPAYSEAEELRWRELCAANPRVHDGAILAVDSVDADSATIACRPDRYKRLALQAAPAIPPSGVWMLGVKGWVTARDAAGAEHLLIARRGAQTRIYSGLWESAPAGGVDPPREGVTEMGVAALAETLAVEAEEELGMELDVRAARVLGVCRDLVAGSDDVFVGVSLAAPIDPRRTPRCQHGRCGWEYSDAAWLSRADAPGFDGRPAPPLVPPTRAMLRALGWI
jgi:hypothetical protein